ncbi:endolytic transglycosylase MltG [Demequina oxidasica]|uniref:endolytic transglycosylase MltG n=1 Tax=Demequina oxidasica TaxID=676199 RepID=UPI000782AFD1|nr:endolytic transglycosylase MltG [Demequina oxidasica]
MSEKITDTLAALQQMGATDYRAHGHDYASADSAQIRRSISRKRAVYGTGIGVTSVAAAGALVFAASAVGGRDALSIGPAGTSTSPSAHPDDAVAPDTSPSPQVSTTGNDNRQGEVGGDESAAADTSTIAPGTDAETILALGAKSLNVSVEEVRAAVIAALPPQAGGNYEGWLSIGEAFDLTDATPQSLADYLVGSTLSNLKASGVAPADYEETLIKASLITQEVRNQSDYAKVAAVIDNRLKHEMRLELDSTVRYISPSEAVFTSDDERATDSPYNTYLYDGLPPGPIGSVTPAAIDAAAHPANSDALYFVTVNLETGETKFASDFETHLANVQELQDWVKANPEYAGSAVPSDEE